MLEEYTTFGGGGGFGLNPSGCTSKLDLTGRAGCGGPWFMLEGPSCSSLDGARRLERKKEMVTPTRGGGGG